MNRYILGLLIAVFVYSSCEDPFDAQLEEAPPQLVVDAWLNNASEPQVIKLSLTQPYLQNTFAEGVTNAEVVVTADNGNSYLFAHTGEGEYVWIPNPGQTIGDIGDNYTLDILVDGKAYTSQSTMNDVPVIDSIFQEYRENEIFLDDGIYCQVFARDLPGLGDTYWIKTFRNDTFLNRAVEFNIAYDAAFDSGADIDGIIFITPVRELVNPVNDDGISQPWLPGDEIRVEIHSITNEAFAYLEIVRDQLLNSLNGIFAEPLANPIGNIESVDNDDVVLGMFNVAAVSTIVDTIR